MPRLNPEQIAQVSGLLAQYIESQRDSFAPGAIPLSAEQKQAMAGFFLPQLTRVAVKPRPSGRGYKATIHSGAFCDSMYCLMILSGAPPHDAAK